METQFREFIQGINRSKGIKEIWHVGDLPFPLSITEPASWDRENQAAHEQRL